MVSRRDFIFGVACTGICRAESFADFVLRQWDSAVVGPFYDQRFNGHVWMQANLTNAGVMRYREILSLARKSSPLETINRLVNQTPYVIDDTPGQVPESFLQYGGDCKDYAFTIACLLLDYGWSLDDIRIAKVIALDGELHDILIVRHKNQYLVCDSYFRDSKIVALDKSVYATARYVDQGFYRLR